MLQLWKLIPFIEITEILYHLRYVFHFVHQNNGRRYHYRFILIQ